MKTSRDKDVPDYKALPLRWPFLLALLTFTCGLVGLLEHLIRSLPNELNRKEIPHEFPFIPAEQRIKFQQLDATTTSVSLLHTIAPTAKTLGPTDANDGPSITEMPSAMVTKRAEINIMAPRPPTSAFANPGILTTYITWINSWAGNPNDEGHNPYTRTPLFPGQEPEPDQCVYQYQGIVMTSNRSACAAIVTPDFNVVLPAGWKRATWLNGRVWFPVGGGCDENYDDWYSGYPSNKHFDLEDLWYQLDVVVPAFESCSMPSGKVKRSPRTALSTRRAVKEARQDITPGRSVVFLYVANHKRGPDNRIIWPMGPDPGGRPWFRGAMYYLARLIGTDQFVMENGRPYLEITTMTSKSLADISSAPPSSMMTTTSTAVSTDASSTPSPGGITTSAVPEPTSSVVTTSVESKPTEISSSTRISSSARESSADFPSSKTEPTDTSSALSRLGSQKGSSPDASSLEQSTSLHSSSHSSTAVTTDTMVPSNIPPVIGIPVATSRPGTSRLDVTSDAATPSVTQIPAPLSSLSTSSTAISSSSTSLPSASSSIPHWVTYIQIPVSNLRIGTQISTDSNGHLTTFTEFEVVVETQLAQIPAIMATASLKTFTDPSNGQPTATITQYGQVDDDGQEEGQPILITTPTTLTNSRGRPTATIITVRPITSIVQTLSDPTRHVATATITQVPVFPHVPGSQPAELVLANTAVSYYAIYFLPVLLTACLLIPIQAIDSEIKLLLPYRLLTAATHGKSSTGNSPTEEGSEEALTMNTSGLLSRFKNGWSVLFFRHHDPISIISDVMLLAVAILITISVETIGLKLRGSCTSTNVRSCILTIAVFSRPARVAQALLALIVGCILVLWFMLARWKSGLAVHPGSVASICALVQIPETRDYLLRGVNRVRWESSVYGGTKGEGDLNKLLERQFRGSRLRLGWENGDRAGTGPRAEEYGLVFCELGDGLKADRGRNTRFGQAIDGSEGAGSWWWWPRPGPVGRQERRPSAVASITAAPSTTATERKTKRTMKYRVSTGERTLQFAFLFVLCGLLAMVLYYENTEFANPSDSPFEYFMDSQSFGVSMLFSGLGQVISFSWDYFFFNFDKRSIYRLMSHRPQPARRSVLHVRSPTVISGLLSSIRHRDVLAGSISLAGILSKFLPAPLASVPFQSSQTWKTHEICVWTTVALLLVMIVVLIAHMWLVKWPAMPAAPDSLAGWIYYVIDSAMLRDFERLSMVSTKERDKRVERMGRLYRFGWMTGVSGFGVSRIGMDYPEGEQGFKMYSLGAAFGMGIAGSRS